MDHEPGLLRIGIFSTLTRISVRMLRHYQEHGVLAPAYVDPFSGHRYYRPDQLADATLLVQLRDAGFSIEKIADVLAHRDPASVEDAIEAQRAELSRSRDALHARLVALDQVSTALKGRPEMTDVTTTTLPAMHLACLRKVIASYADEGTLWAELMPLLGQVGASFPADAVGGATFHDPDYRESDVDVEVWMQVTGPFDPIGPLEYRHEPEREIVTATLFGDYSQMPAITSQVGSYLAEHNLQTGPMFNIYRVSPAQNPNPSSWVTDVCFPILPS